jgi:hypothetical protein
MSIETDVLKQFFAAINRNDMQAITKDFDSEIVRIEPEGFPTAGTYRGIAEVQEHVTRGRGTWAEGTCEPEKYCESLARRANGHNGREADSESPLLPEVHNDYVSFRVTGVLPRSARQLKILNVAAPVCVH